MTNEVRSLLSSIINFLGFRHQVAWLARTTARDCGNKVREKGRKISQEADFHGETRRHLGKQIIPCIWGNASPKPGTQLRPPWAQIGHLLSFALLCSFPSSNFEHFFFLNYFSSSPASFFVKWSLSDKVKSCPVASSEKRPLWNTNMN